MSKRSRCSVSSSSPSSAASMRPFKSVPRSISSNSLARNNNIGGSSKCGAQRSKSSKGGPSLEHVTYGPNGVFDLVWSSFSLRKKRFLEHQPFPTHSEPKRYEKARTISCARLLFSALLNRSDTTLFRFRGLKTSREIRACNEQLGVSRPCRARGAP